MAIHWKPTQPQAQAFAMAPMVDMVFLLLVFFMCVTAVSGGRTGAQIALPQTHAAPVAGAASTKAAQIVLSVEQGGALAVNGRPCEQAELVPLLRQLRRESGRESVVRIRAHAHVSYSRIEPLLGACAQVGLNRISYAAHEATVGRTVLAPQQNTPAAGQGGCDAGQGDFDAWQNPHEAGQNPHKARRDTHDAWQNTHEAGRNGSAPGRGVSQ